MLRHLQDRHTLVPARIRGGAFLHLFPDTSDISARIYVEEHRPQQIAGLPGPVLERLFEEIGNRNDQTAVIPDAHHDISEADILYAAPFALDNHDIVKADGFGKGHLNTGNEVFKRRLRGGTEDEASDTGRGHQRDSNGTHPRYRHQHHGNGNEANDTLRSEEHTSELTS